MSQIEALTASRPWLLAGWTMLHFFWVGGALGLAVAVLRRALRAARPEVRYAASLLGLASLAVAPAAIAAVLVAASQPIAPRGVPAELRAVIRVQPNIAPPPVESPIPSISMSVPSRAGGPASLPVRTTPEDFLVVAATWLPGLWLIGAPVTFALLATGLLGAERFRRKSRTLIEGDLVERCRRLAGALGLVRPVALGVCDCLMTPVLLGVVRPMILLPASALTGWTPEQVEMALLHELAHVRRLDNLANLVQRTVESVLFFHPAVWWVSGWIRLEREHCCDRLVVMQTGRARPYAELLAALAMPANSPGRAAVAMAEAPIVARIRRILNLEDHPMRLSRVLIALVAGLLVAPAALITSQAGPSGQDGAQAPAPAAAVPAQGLGDARMEALFRRAVHGAEMFQDVQGRAHALSRVAAAQARVGDREAARKTFQQAVAVAETVSLDEARYSPHILLWVAKAQARAGFRDDAIATVRTMLRIAEAPVSNAHHKSALFTSLVVRQVELKDEDGIRETLRLARRFYETSKEASIRAFAPQRLVHLQAESVDLGTAYRMAHDPELFQGPDAETRRRSFLFYVVRRIKEGDREAAGPILAEALRALEADKDAVPARDRRPRNQELKALAEAHARLGRFGEALKLAQAIDPEGLPDRLAGPIRVRFLDGGRFNKALVYAEIGDEQAKKGDRDGARRSAEEILRIVATIEGDSDKGTPLGRALKILASAGDIDGALRIADTSKPVRRTSQYEVIAAARREAGDEAGARATLAAALRFARERFDALEPEDPERPPAGKSERNQLLAKSGRLQAMLGDLKGAIATIGRINFAGEKIEGLTALARDRALANDMDGAMEAVGLINAPKSQAEAARDGGGGHARGAGRRATT